MPAAPVCPGCKKHSVLRASTRTLSEALLRVLGIAPFRCQDCHHRFVKFYVGRHASNALLDRREHFRIPVRLYLSFSGGRIRGEGHVVDLSMGGCMIQSAAHVRVDDIFYLEIALSDQDKPVELAGIVRSVTTRGIAFQFLRKSQENKRLLAFIQSHAATGDASKPKGAPTSEAA